MYEVEADRLRLVVEHLHGGRATFLQSVPLSENFDGKLVWQGVVHVFNVTGNSKATRAYAWSSPGEGGAKRKFFAVLHIPPITSPVEAVRAEGNRGGLAPPAAPIAFDGRKPRA